MHHHMHWQSTDIHWDAFLHFYLISRSRFGVGQLSRFRAFVGPTISMHSIHKNPSSKLSSSCTQGLQLASFPAGFSQQFIALKQTTVHAHTIPASYKQSGVPNSLHMFLGWGRKPESETPHSKAPGSGIEPVTFCLWGNNANRCNTLCRLSM